MTGPTVVRPPWSWIVVMVGFALQTVAVVGAVALLVGDTFATHRQSVARGGFTGDGFLDGLGAFVGAVLAFVVALVAIAMVLVLVLSARPGGRRNGGLILGVCLLLPVGWVTFGAVTDDVGVLSVTSTVGTVLVLIGICVPATWRFARRPAAAPHPPYPPHAPYPPHPPQSTPG